MKKINRKRGEGAKTLRRRAVLAAIPAAGLILVLGLFCTDMTGFWSREQRLVFKSGTEGAAADFAADAAVSWEEAVLSQAGQDESGGQQSGPVSTKPVLEPELGQDTAVLQALSEEDRQLEEENQGAAQVWNSADLTSPLPVPAISAQSAVVIDANSGRVLYEKRKDEKAYPASTTKIMTALLAIEQGDLNQKVKVAQKAVGVEGSSIYLAPGEELPLRDLVYGLMLRSGNDSAVAIACEIGGGVEPFVEMMNRRARELGAKNTNFVNPNGLHDDNHYTTAYDMALIAKQAMHNPAFREVAGAKSYQAHREEGKFNTFYNKNKTVYQYEGGNGIKIGYTKVAGRTLVASSKKGNMELICVVMGAPNWFQDAYALMDYVYSNYEPVKIAEAQRPLKAVKIKGGDKDQVYVGVKEDVYCPVKKNAAPDLGIACAVNDSGKAPVSRWQAAGLLHVYVAGEYCYSEPLYYMEDIGKQKK